MYVYDLISLFDPAELTLIEAIPVARRRFIDVAIRAATCVQRHFVHAVGITYQRRTVTSSGSSGGDKWIPACIFTSAICVEVKAAGSVIHKPSHDPGFAQWA